MIENPTKQEHNLLLSKVAEEYRRQGYTVIAEPQPGDLPFDLDMYRPDLLVKKTNSEGYIIEIKSSVARISVERYREIAETVSQYPGWRFLLITNENVSLTDGEMGRQSLSLAEIQRRKEQSDHLISIGETDAAFLTLWTITEALMRKRAEQAMIPIERFPSMALIKHLYSQGELSIEQYDKVMALVETRNRLVHGFQTTGLETAAIELQKLVDELLKEYLAASIP